MEFLVIMYAVASFMAVVLIFSVWGKKIDDKQRRIDMIGEVKVNGAYAELDTSFYSRFIAPTVRKVQGSFAKMMPKKKQKQVKNKNAQLERQLRLAGMYIDPADFQFTKTIVMILSITVALVLMVVYQGEALIRLLIIAVGALIGIMGPTYYLRSRVSSHQGGIRKQLPDAMDMIGVCIEAGLSFDSSLLKISEKLKGPFIDELMIVYREIQMGRSRREALMNLANNSDIPELKTFASALSQAEQLGIPINNVMNVQSEQLRLTRRQQAQEKGQKATVKMLLPMLGLIFPVIFIVLLGPTVMNMITTFSGGGAT